MIKHVRSRSQNGFSILEVMIGIFIFVVGLLALSALQGALTRAMADAKVRTTAANIAERTIEATRGFSELLSDTATPKTFFAYNDIVSTDDDDPPKEVVNGIEYTIDMDVTDYFYEIAGDDFTTTAPTGATASTYKQVEVTVSWGADGVFRADEGTEITAADLGSGEIVLTSTIPALVTSASARVSDETVGDSLAPPVNYSPGQNPNIIPISLGRNKFKESLLPQPDVLRGDITETRFDVITYSQVGDSAKFLRREEFAVAACECDLYAADSSVVTRRPMVWAGDEYAGGHHVEKPYGVYPGTLPDSSLCETCCRDHHDGGSSDYDNDDTYYNVTGPFRKDVPAANPPEFASDEYEYTGTARASDHKHYKGDGSIAGVGDRYLEACRLVRIDGFFRVAQDFRREDQYIFPADYFTGGDYDTEIQTYSDYVTNAVLAYNANAVNGYPTNSPPCIGGPSPCVAEPAAVQGAPETPINPGEFPSWTGLADDTDEQQLRSRGFYIDYISDDLRLFLNNCITTGDDNLPALVNDCCIRSGAVANGCTTNDLYMDKTGSANILEMLPFFDVQLTALNGWTETPIDSPVDARNDPIVNNNTIENPTYLRGIISMDIPGASVVSAFGHRGNIGFTDTVAIDPLHNTLVTSAILDVVAGTGDGSTPQCTSTSDVVGGSYTLTDIKLNQFSQPIVEGTGACCDGDGATWWCALDSSFAVQKVKISGYGKPPTTRYACSESMSTDASGTNAAESYTTFILNDISIGNTHTINFQITPCTN